MNNEKTKVIVKDMKNLSNSDLDKIKNSITGIKFDRTGKCKICRRKNCNCNIIEKIKELGWKVVKEESGLYRIVNPDGNMFNICYVEECYAWNFAVRRHKEQKRW